MKFNFKKIASVLAGAVMATSTVAFAAAANYPAPFVKNGNADVAIVYGSMPGADVDLVAAIDISTNLQYALAKQTGSTGTTTTVSVSEGNAVDLATSSQKLYYGSSINSAKTTVTGNELKTLLKDGTFTDDAGTSYTYTQSITIGSKNITYGTSASDLNDPELILDLGTDATAPVYTYKLTLNKNLDVSSSNVQGNEIEILGKKFTIGANSDVSGTDKVLYLYGSGASVTLNEGEEKEVTIGDKTYKVKLGAVTQITQGGNNVNRASVSIDDGTAKTVSENSASTIAGLSVFAKSITYSAKESTTNTATLSIGGEVLKLKDGANAYKGTDETSIQNTKVILSNSSDGKLSGIQVAVAAQSSTKDYLLPGNEYTDPVFGGLKLSFASVNPALNDTSRGVVVVDTDNSRNARVTFTTDLAKVEKTFVFAHDQNNSDDGVTPILADQSNKTIHIVEGENIGLNEYAIINAGDYGRIIKLTSVPTGALDSNSKIYFEDALTGEQVFDNGLTVGTSGVATTNLNGQPYYFNVTNGTQASTVKIYWGSGASYNSAGDAVTVSPRIKLKSGNWLSILAPVTITNGTTYSLPGYETLSTYEAGRKITFANESSTRDVWVSLGNVNYAISVPANLTSGTLYGIGTTNGTVNCNFDATNGAAILLQEKKKSSESGNSDNGDVICVATDRSGSSTPVEISVSQPYVTGTWSGLQTWSSDSYQQSGVTRFGTYVKYNSQDNDKVEIYSPNEQMFANVLFVSEDAVVASDEGTTTGTGVKELGSIIVKDTEVSQVSSKNLIVVGGSCVNKLAAELLTGKQDQVCGAEFEKTTGVGAGSYLIQTFSRTGGKVATLVAGYNAADTVNAAKYLITKPVDTTVNKKYKGTTATTAELVTTTSTTTATSTESQ